MASRLDQALDDVIRDRRRETHSRKNRPVRDYRQDNRGGVRKRSEPPVISSFIRTFKIQGSSQRGRGTGREIDSSWAHDRFEDDLPHTKNPVNSRLGPRREHGGGIELAIENLHYNVTEQDVLELFSTVGTVEKARLFYDRSGRSTGQAKVKYASSSDAERAIEKFDKVELDGQPMKIEISQPAARSGRGSTGRYHSDRSGNRHGRSSQGRGRGDRSEKSAEDLDKEMENYMKQNDNESMLLD